MIPLELGNSEDVTQDPVATTPTPSPSVESKKSLKDFARLIRDKHPTVYDDLDDDTLAKSVLKKFPDYADMVDVGEITKAVTATVSPSKIPMSSFQKQLHESLQPTSGQVQVGVPATQRLAGALDIEVNPVLDFDPNNTNTGVTQLNLEKLFELGQISLDDPNLNDEQLLDLVDKRISSALGIDPKGRRQLRDMGVDPFAGKDKRAFANEIRGAIGKAGEGNKFSVPLTQSWTQVAEAYKQGGIAAAFEQAKAVTEEDLRAKASIHEITPEEVERVESARRAVSFKLGVANANIAQNSFWTNLLSAGLYFDPSKELFEGAKHLNLIPGAEVAKRTLAEAQPFLPEFYKNQSNFDAMIEVVPVVATSTARMLAMASLGGAVGEATSVGPVIGSIAGMQADTGIQNLDKPLTEQATHQLITLAMSGAGVGAGVARNVLAAKGIFIPNIIYTPVEGLAMGLGTYGSMEILSPEATFQQKLANSLVGGLLPLGFAAARGLTPATKVKPTSEAPREPLQLTTGIGDLRLPETFPIYEGKFADNYTVNLSRPGEAGIELPYKPGEQIPLFDAVIGGNKARVQIGKTLQGMDEATLTEAFKTAGGMETNLPTDRNQLITAIMDLHSSKFPLMEATTNNAAVEGWMGITKTDQHLETPFHFSKEYKLIEDAQHYYKVQDTENTNTIFRIAKLSPGGLTAEIFPVSKTLSEKTFRIPDFQGQNAVTQPLLFPEPQAGKETSKLGTPATMEVGRDGALARLKILRDFAKTSEYKQLTPEGKKAVKTELGQLRTQISTPVERTQTFVSREEAARHKENLEKFTRREDFKQLDPQYQELVRREVSDLDFLLTGNKGTPEDVARQEQIYRPSSGKIPVNIPTNFIEKAIVESIADIELVKSTGETKPFTNSPVPSDSPLWRAVEKAPTETLADVVKRAGTDPSTLTRTQLELRAFDAIGGKRVEPSSNEPSFISSARVRLDQDSLAGGMVISSQIFDQALVYAYDNIYKPGMRFLDFSERMLEKFGDEIGPRIHDLWDQVLTTPGRPKDLVEPYMGASEKYGELLAQVPKAVEPKPIGDAEVIALAKDADTVMADTPLPRVPLDPVTKLYPEDWTRGVDTTPEQVAAHVAEIITNKRIVSQETYDAARQDIRDSLREMSAGVNPKQLRAMSVVMAYHVENGIYNFGKAFSTKAIELFGDVAKSNMYELAEDTFRYLRLYRQSPVLNKLTQLPGGIGLGKVLDMTHKIAFGGVDAFRKAFSLGSRSPEAREIGDVWAEKQANIARAVDTAKAQLSVVHDWAEGFVYHTGKGSKLNPSNYTKSELSSKDLRLEMNYALDEGRETALLNNLNVPSDIKVLIAEMRTTLADMRNQIRQIAPNALEEVIENYFPRLWERPGETASGGEPSGGAPMTSGKSFLKQRTIDSTRQGVEEFGWKLKSENFVDNFITKYEEMQKFIKMNEVLNYMKKNKMEKVVDRAQLGEIKEFYKPLNDKVSEITERVEKANGEVVYNDTGKVRVYPAMVADLINAHLAPSLHRFPAFRAWNAFTNFANQFQLVGYFHAALVSADAAVRLPGIAAKGLGFDAWQHLYHGEPTKAMGVLKESAKALVTGIFTPVGVASVVYHGNKMFKEWNVPGSQGGKYQQRVRFAQMGGAHATMEGHFQSKAIEGLVKNIRNVTELLASTDPEVNKLFGTAKEVASGVSKLPFAAIEIIMRPMLEQFVPRAKLGVQYYLQGYEIARMGSRANAKEVRRTSAKVEAVVSDTLGQMNYGNLHMNKTVKEAIMSVVRATGFQFGAQRTAYMPVLDTANFLKDLATPDVRADFTHRMAYLVGMGIGLPVMHGLAQAIATAYNTGKAEMLTDPKDAVAFRTGRTDQNGDPERWYIPNLFTKEIYPVFGRALQGRWGDAAKHQLEIIGHKLNPGVNVPGDLLSNKDFYGKYINDPNSPDSSLSQYGDYALSQLTPFFIKNKEMMEQRGITGMGRFATFFGPTPAPQYINASTAEDVMMGILKEAYPKTGKSKEEYERGVLKRKYMNQWRQATLVGNEAILDQLDTEMDAAITEGKITIADRKAIFKGVDKSRTEDLFKRLVQQNIQDALRIYETWMSPEERAIVFPTLRGSRKRINKMALSAEAKEDLLNRLDSIIDRDSKLEQLLDQDEEAEGSAITPPTSTPDLEP